MTFLFVELNDDYSTSNAKTKWKSMEESTFSTTLPNASTSMQPVPQLIQIIPPVQLRSSIKSETEISANKNNDDDDDDEEEEEDADENSICKVVKSFDENMECNFIATQPETDSDL